MGENFNSEAVVNYFIHVHCIERKKPVDTLLAWNGAGLFGEGTMYDLDVSTATARAGAAGLGVGTALAFGEGFASAAAGSTVVLGATPILALSISVGAVGLVGLALASATKWIMGATETSSYIIENIKCTALGWAVFHSNQNGIHALLRAGANPQVLNSQGENAWDIARRVGAPSAVIQLLGSGVR